jgi:hypothetical protein
MPGLEVHAITHPPTAETVDEYITNVLRAGSNLISLIARYEPSASEIAEAEEFPIEFSFVRNAFMGPEILATGIGTEADRDIRPFYVVTPSDINDYGQPAQIIVIRPSLFS